MSRKNSVLFKIIIAILAMALIFPIHAFAVEPRASDYPEAYSAYLYPAGWGKIQVWFEVDGTNYMDEIGTLIIYLYESTDNETWTWIKTFEYQDTPGMLGYNNYYHDGYVEYRGTIGRYYKAYVCVWAGKDGDGDTRYFWTSPKKATLFAG